MKLNMKFWKYFHSMVLGSVVRNNCQTMTYLKSETWDLSLLVGPLTQDLEPISWVGPGILKSAQDPRPKILIICGTWDPIRHETLKVGTATTLIGETQGPKQSSLVEPETQELWSKTAGSKALVKLLRLLTKIRKNEALV